MLVFRLKKNSNNIANARDDFHPKAELDQQSAESDQQSDQQADQL